MDFFKKRSPVAILTLSGMVIAIYVTLMFFTQSFAFGPYQVRLATGLYALAYPFPFLILPLGAANFLSNLLGGLGPLDLIGGAAVGLITSGAVALLRKFHLPRFLIIPVVLFGPGLIVPIWLSPLTGLPYTALAISLCIGQALPAVLGYLLVLAMDKIAGNRKGIDKAEQSKEEKA